MATYSDYDQRKLDQESGHDLDRRKEKIAPGMTFPVPPGVADAARRAYEGGVDRRVQEASRELDSQLEMLATLRSFERLIDAAENVVIIHAMGWDVDAVIAALRAALPADSAVHSKPEDSP